MQMGLYVHFPFCISKCYYCDFNSQVAPASLHHRYLSALLTELQSRLSQPGLPMLQTAFFGGGTPTIYSAQELGRMLATVSDCGLLKPDAEVTCEANPDTVTAEKLQQLRGVGFNRISLGVQSLDDAELATLGRSHDSATAVTAIQAARDAFVNLSIDLIYGIPGQTADSWGETLRRAIALRPDHISAYGLMIEPETPLHAMVTERKLQPLSDDAYADLYAQAQRTLHASGYAQYEISNYARPGYRCRHSLLYWGNRQYLGCGAGAAQYLAGVRSSNLTDTVSYCEALESRRSPVESQERLTGLQWAGETIMLGLRTSDGVDLRDLSTRCGTDLEVLHHHTISAMVDAGIATYADGLLRLTPEKGFLLHSQVARRFLM
jgi:oxygen-independent coproporphyrinogen-3 oxidase